MGRTAVGRSCWVHMHFYLRGFLLCLAVVLAVPALAQEEVLPLSPSQRAWLKAHPTVTVGLYDNLWLPFERVENGQPEGLTYDYLVEATNQLGLKVTTRRYASWADVLQAACSGEVDIVMDVALTAERTRCMVFTREYAEAPVALVSRLQDSRAARDAGLEGLRVVTERDFAFSDSARERYPAAQHVQAQTTLEALQMVSDGHADVYLGNAYVATALIAETGIPRIGLLRPSDMPLDSLHFGVPNAKQTLAEVLDLALTSIPEARSHAIRAQWLPPLNWLGSGKLALTASERQALAQPLSIGFAPRWAPISFIDEEGQPSGIAGEYLEYFHAVGADKLKLLPLDSWRAIRDAMRDGRLDAVIGVPNDTTAFGDDWVFSQPFLTVSNVIVVRDSSGRVLDMSDLNGSRVALSDPERLGSLLRAQAPDVVVVEVATAQDGLERVRSGRADAYIGNLAVVDRFLRDRYSGELHIAAPAGVEDRLALAVRPQHAALASAFDRMLMSMTPREREAIRTDWMAVEYRTGFDWQIFLKWAIPLALVLLTAGVVHAVGHIRLRREVEQRRLIEKRLAEVTGNLPAVVYQVQRSPDGQLSFSYIAGDMPSLFGLEVEQAIRNERELFSRVHPEDQPLLATEVERAAAAVDNIVLDFRVRSEDGWRWIRSRAQPHHADDGSLQWSGYWIDVTQVRAQAQALEAAKASAEQATEAKASFLATMSHEIRTPMSGVLGMLEILAHTGLDSEQRRVLATIEDSAQMLRQILDDILDFSKMEAGALVLEATPISLRRTIDNTQQMLMTQATAKGLLLSNRIDPRVAQHHMADGIRLRQVLFNLLSNAIKFTAQGRVNILLDLLEERPGAQRIRLTIHDTGIGISEEQQTYLFSPFMQAEASTTRRYGGTGLGLSICQRLAELMDGQLELRSALGEGTEVSLTVWLPTAAADADVAATAVPSETVLLPLALRQQNVLIVEDHPTNQDLMRWRMQQLGLKHEVAGDGLAALAMLAKGNFDLIITDCRMPGMDGYEMTREIRRMEASNPHRKRMPIIALTASALDEEARRCQEAGMDDFLAKPVPLVTLRQALIRWLHEDAEHAGDHRDEGQGGDLPVQVKVPDSRVPVVQTISAREALIARFGSMQVADRMIVSIVATTQEDLQAMDVAIAAQDDAACADRLHRIAGGLGAVGAEDDADWARELQAAVEADGIVAHDEEWTTFRTAVMKYLKELQS